MLTNIEIYNYIADSLYEKGLIDKELYEKCHDGTNLSKVYNNIKKFANKNKLKNGIFYQIYDENGVMLKDSSSMINIMNVDYSFEQDNENLHIVRNMGLRGDTGHITSWDGGGPGDWANMISTFGEWDFSYLLTKNKNGNYTYRSYTLVSPNGQKMTLIRNNKFNENSEDSYIKLYTNFIKDTNSFSKELSDLYSSKLNHLDVDINSLNYNDAQKIRNRVMKECLKEKGTLTHFIKQNYVKKFEENNIKLRIQK